MVVDEYLKAKKLDVKNGLSIEMVTPYTSVPAYYTDFISGSFELGDSAPGTASGECTIKASP